MVWLNLYSNGSGAMLQKIETLLRNKSKATQKHKMDKDFVGNRCGDIYGCGYTGLSDACNLCVKCNPKLYWTKRRNPLLPEMVAKYDEPQEESDDESEDEEPCECGKAGCDTYQCKCCECDKQIEAGGNGVSIQRCDKCYELWADVCGGK